jgi:hypothetical protein
MECWLEWSAGWNGVLAGMECWLEWSAGWNGVLAGMECWLEWRGYRNEPVDKDFILLSCYNAVVMPLAVKPVTKGTKQHS